jgi:formamidase
VKKEGARSIPPREHGGNCDIKNLSIGSKIFLPVYVKGGMVSVGDLHFCQGDGEITFCGAIEMNGFLEMKAKVVKGGMKKMAVKNNPIFLPGPMGPQYSEWITFEGISVDEHGKQHYLDATVAFRQACLNAINYLKTLGYTGEQAYILLGCAPVEGRIASIVDIPNACCTLSIPTAIFDFDIRPKSS